MHTGDLNYTLSFLFLIVLLNKKDLIVKI